MANKTPRAIGTMIHRFRVDIPPFEVTTFSSYYDFGTEYYAGSKVGGESYTLMANTWRFVRFPEKDDDGMNKESEVIDELIEDERRDCETQPEKTEWSAGEKPPVGVWLDCVGLTSGTVLDVVKFLYLGDTLAIAHSKLVSDMETTISWKQYSYRIHIDQKEKALAEIAFALATKVMGEDAASEIDFNRDNDFSCDYRNMAQAIIDGCIGHVEYTGKR
ncbi:hypothetical protein [Escherichia coli]|uniref:hypothetical protein n=1 Tax=Escherichia coli TaxID=562 RepID=UPI000A3C073D|nr:hypothetical protein [Escherichia coli]AVU66301.1 hypothetical protein A9X72_14175 [Escherichia coli]OUG07562.1 hypothetical protein AZ048_003875 [Escherichia coli]